MTLGFRLNLSITLLLILILVLGTTFVIHNARRAVSEEAQASASLALQLLDVARASSAGDDNDALWRQLVHHIGALETTRHLEIAVRDGEGDVVAAVNTDAASDVADAPTWFVRLVTPEPVEFRRTLGKSSDREIVIRSNPAGEITEAWNDARPLLALQFLFALLVEVLVFVTVGHALRPLGRVLEAFEEIEQGRFQTRLPRFGLPELQRISQKFNHMAEALEQEKNDNRRLTLRALSIQEEERRYMARELHDELGQSISAIKALAALIRQRAEQADAPVHHSAESIGDIADRTHHVIRGMVRQLRPPTLDEFGLVAALQHMVDDWNSHYPDTFCSLRAESSMSLLGDEVKVNVYRIVQECLTNVAKHAAASTVNIHLRTARTGSGRADTLLLDIQDDGVGLRSARRHWGVGLRSIHDRVAVLNGAIEVSNPAQGGMALHIAVPVAETEERR